MDMVQEFRRCFEYKDGHLYWKTTIGTRAISGNKAGKSRKDGYIGVRLHGKEYLLHRVIFAVCNGYLPQVVDHQDHCRSNNKIENLRSADYSKNAHNSRISTKNSTGVKGVRFKGNKFEARIAKNGITHQVGTFNTLVEAEIALVEYRKTLHDIFACHG